jgi:hypothetical protein
MKQERHTPYGILRHLLPWLALTAVLSIGCVGPIGSPTHADIHAFRDHPIPEDVRPWLSGNAQSLPTPEIRAEADGIQGRNRRELLFLAMRRTWDRFTYDRWLNSLRFTRTAGQLFRSGVLGGCGDYALAQTVLFRAVGIPARLVVTANVDWIYQYRGNDLVMTEGHAFIEVFLEKEWHLVDPTYRWLFSKYDPGKPSFPHGEYFCKRGRDFWEMGIEKGRDLDRALRAVAMSFEGAYADPRYPKCPI